MNIEEYKEIYKNIIEEIEDFKSSFIRLAEQILRWHYTSEYMFFKSSELYYFNDKVVVFKCNIRGELFEFPIDFVFGDLREKRKNVINYLRSIKEVADAAEAQNCYGDGYD